ncbi:restriction endonuclease subunit S [Xanthomonas dyei]|uniref:Type I restriction modification DNA specificity domain-containing protein n=1 Tax=Xanthomonas dyei TaxID=743699 RepID=A0A2S7C1L1_9XANT|nr:restriction endonuclease subunit S [Xanthomonas dyei]PPU55457.1 hypothetical protein XdyCFBP7245_13595 [Xanthomonas dyei]
MLPEGWSRQPLHEVAEVRTGVAKGKTGLLDPVELPYLRVANVQDGFIDLSEVKSIAVERHQIDRYSLKQGDILMTEGGDFDKLGRGAVWDGTLDPCLHQNHVFAVRAKQDSVNPLFLSALSGSEYGRTYFLSCAKRSTNLASINSSQLKAFPVLLPPIAEQKRIAHILSTWDQAIATAEQQLASSRRYAEVLRSALLSGQRRFGDYAPWQPKPLSEMIRESRVAGSGGDVAKKITVKLYGRGVVGKSDKRAGSESTRYYRRSAGQFIYSKLDFLNGAFGRIPAALDGYESTLDLPAFDFLQGIDPRWFLHYVSRETFYTGHLGLANGGRKARRVNPNDLLRVSIPTPGLEEQARIADAIDTALNLVTTQERLLSLMREEKSALMSQLLTGKRRVRLPDDEVASA